MIGLMLFRLYINWIKNNNNDLIGLLLEIVCHDVVSEYKKIMVLENIIKRQLQRSWIGKKLIKYMEDYCRKIKCYYITFVYSQSRKEAHKFYESLGYAINAVQGFKKYLYSRREILK